MLEPVLNPGKDSGIECRGEFVPVVWFQADDYIAKEELEKKLRDFRIACKNSLNRSEEEDKDGFSRNK